MKYSIIGFGQVGKNLALKLGSNNLLDFVYVRNFELARTQAEQIGFPPQFLTSDLNQVFASEVVIIAISDNQISSLIEDISNVLHSESIYRVIFHTSGLMNSDIFSKINNNHTSFFAAHPIQTFFSNSHNLLNNIYWGIDSGNTNPELIKNIITELDGKPYFFDEKVKNNRALYHLMCVATSNFSVATIEFAKILAQEIGISDKRILSKLLEQTTQNIIMNINSDTMPLTGPFARNDYDAIEKYSDSLKSNQNLMDIFENYKQAITLIMENKFQSNK